jgi:hypothetical protein
MKHVLTFYIAISHKIQLQMLNTVSIFMASAVFH